MCESDELRQNLASDIVQCLWERLQPRQILASDIAQCLWERLQPRQILASDIAQCLWERLQPRRFSHGLAASIIFPRNGSLRCALLQEKKILPAALPDIVETSGVGLLQWSQGHGIGVRARASCAATRRRTPKQAENDLSEAGMPSDV